MGGLEGQRDGVGLGEAHGGPRPLGGHHPRPDVAVVVEPGHDDLVAGAEGPAHGRGEPHRERGHRLAEDDAVGRAAQQFRARPRVAPTSAVAAA